MRRAVCLELVAVLLAAASLVGVGAGPMRAAATDPTRCVVPADFTRLELPLKRTARHLASGDLLVIVALGSSSTAGAGASSTATTYPGRLAVELAQRFPSQPIKILNHGVNGERAIDMLARFDKSVAAEHPDLVLWQIGTNAVLNGYERTPSTSLVRDGIRRMKTIGADVILIDPQFAPKVIAKPQIEDMVDLISTVAAQESVNLFHRFALMRHWAKVDGMPFDAFVSPDGLHMNDWSYGCLAQVLAAAIAGAAMPNRSRAGTD